MVRKTKEDAALTRQKIIAAAREVFLSRGVSRTSMEQIAAKAGVTRGAIYWHFNSKQEILYALREGVFLPLIDRMDNTLLKEGSADPLTRIQNFLSGTINVLNDNVETRETYEIMMIKCEYVEESESVLEQIINSCSDIEENIRLTYERAKSKGLLRDNLTPEQYAKDTHMFFSGLLHTWIKHANDSHIRTDAHDLIKAHIDMRRK